MAEELERSQLGVELEGCWCGARMLMMFWWQTRGQSCRLLLNVGEAYVSRWMMKFNSGKSKVMVVEKREAGMSWKIGKKILEELESSST